jgi:hypothetical protein
VHGLPSLTPRQDLRLPAAPGRYLRAPLVALAGAAIGILTSLGQTYLPFELSPLANSASSWSLAAFLLSLVEVAPRRGAVLGAVALATMIAGYAVATELRGFTVGTRLLVFWGLASIVVGPALGAGAAWVRGRDPIRIAAGVAVIVGILVGEGVYGLTVVADTTAGPYWVGATIAGLAVAILVSVRKLRTFRLVATCAALTAILASAFYLTYSGNLIALL